MLCFRALLLLLLSCGFESTAAATHSLYYYCTAVWGTAGLPEVIVVARLDGRDLSYYDSEARDVSPRQGWLAKPEDPEDWKTNSFFVADKLLTIKKSVKETPGAHTLQQLCGCEQDQNGIATGHWRLGYDGQDYLSLDTQSWTWHADHRPLPAGTRREPDSRTTQSLRTFLEQHCVEWLKQYVNVTKGLPDREELPQVFLSHKDSASWGSELTCLATGFFPRDVELSWRRDGQVVVQEGGRRDQALPNGDGTYQLRKSVRTRADDYLWTVYSCTISHTSWGEEIVRYWVLAFSRPTLAAGLTFGLLCLIAFVVGLALLMWRSGAHRVKHWCSAFVGEGVSVTNSSSSSSSATAATSKMSKTKKRQKSRY